jgi:hypothetical protein
MLFSSKYRCNEITTANLLKYDRKRVGSLVDSLKLFNKINLLSNVKFRCFADISFGGIMKIIAIAFFGLFAFHSLYSQIDSSAESFFPTSIGNSWHYQYTQTSGYITTLTRDSITTGSHFLFFDSSSVPTYEIDSTLNVFSYPTTGYRRLQYKLKAKKGEMWVLYNISLSTRFVARVDDEYENYVVGILTQVKQIGYYYQPVSDTTNFSAWQSDDYLASGFGFYLQITEASQTPAEELYGCIINGKIYGTMTSVRDDMKDVTPSSYKLYPAFPNPFNPSTAISYLLPKTSNVILKVYDMLGREISTLVNEEQQKGNHQIYFKPYNLASGIYLVRISTESFTATNRIIYAK